MLRIALTLAVAAHTVVAIAEETTGARLTSSEVLLTAPDPMVAKLADCQPLKGQPVQIIETQNGPYGSISKVKIVDGPCANKVGWVGITHLEFGKQH